MLGELPDLPHLPELPGRGATADHDRPRAGARQRPRRRPAAGRLAADRRPGRRPPPGPQRCSPRTSTRSRSRRRATTGAVQDPGRRARGRWPRPSRSRAATRCSPTTAPGASSPRRWPRGCATTSPTCAAGCPGVDRLVVQVDEPALPAVLAGSVPDRLRASTGTAAVDPPEASAALALGARGDRRAPAPSRGCTAARADTPLALLRGAGARGLSVDLALCRRADHDALAEALEAGETRRARAWCRPPTRPRPPTEGQGPSRCCAGSTCSASTPATSATGWCSARPAGWPARRPPGRGRRSPRCAGAATQPRLTRTTSSSGRWPARA